MKTAFPGTSACCGIASEGTSHRGWKAQHGAGDIVGVELDADPAAVEGFGNLTRDVAPRKRIEDELSRLR